MITKFFVDAPSKVIVTWSNSMLYLPFYMLHVGSVLHERPKSLPNKLQPDKNL